MNAKYYTVLCTIFFSFIYLIKETYDIQCQSHSYSAMNGSVKKNDEGKEDNFAQSDALNLSQPLQHDI